jgi:hypothetical protein
MRNKISMRVLMEAMNKLETEAYQDFVPSKLGKNWSMKVGDFDDMAAHYEKDDELDTILGEPGPSGDTTKSMKKPQSAEDEFIQSLLKVAEDMDFGGDTKTMTYDLADTQEDAAYDTTEMVGFVDAAADALAANLATNMESFHGLSPEEMEDRVKSELMDVLRDMDATDLYDRS